MCHFFAVLFFKKKTTTTKQQKTKANKQKNKNKKNPETNNHFLNQNKICILFDLRFNTIPPDARKTISLLAIL